jgi:hypothetical protein
VSRVFRLEEGRRRFAPREARNKQSWSIDFYNGRRARCVTCDTLKGRPTGIDGEKRLMSLIPEQSITAIGGETTDLALDGSSIDVPGQSLADLVWPQRPAWRR